MIYLLALFVLCAGFTPYSRIFMGLTIGGVASLYNLYLLQKKVNQFGDSVVLGERPKSLGLISRFASAIFVVLIAMKFKEHISMPGILIGLLSSYVVMYVDLVISHLIKTDKRR